jgi:glyoxylase-like metal-dependent hydrolase (beta-lactamase superfamily II)
VGRRQEQEPAREEVSEVAPSVLRLELPIHMPGLGHVNCYALLDRRGAALIDPGLPGPASWKALQQRLRSAGIELRHVHTVLVTHSHPDHFGGASFLARESGAEVVAHRAFAFGPTAAPPPPAEVSVDDLAAQAEAGAREAEDSAAAREGEGGAVAPPAARSLSDPLVLLRARFRRRTPWGGEGPRPPLGAIARWTWNRLVHGISPVPVITRHVENGDVLDLAGREWFVVHTPGHTADHFCLHDPDTGTLLAGDHVLPSITPHISGLSSSSDPLASFFYSLDRVAEIAGVKLALPAHGHPFDDLRGRAEAIKRHHHERLDKVRAIAAELGTASVEQFSKRLFAPRSWGGMAESETYAHLEHLRHAGAAERRRGDDGVLLYTLV